MGTLILMILLKNERKNAPTVAHSVYRWLKDWSIRCSEYTCWPYHRTTKLLHAILLGDNSTSIRDDANWGRLFTSRKHFVLHVTWFVSIAPMIHMLLIKQHRQGIIFIPWCLIYVCVLHHGLLLFCNEGINKSGFYIIISLSTDILLSGTDRILIRCSSNLWSYSEGLTLLISIKDYVLLYMTHKVLT